MSEEKAKELGIKPMATWVAGALGGVDPSIMGIGPVAATKKVLKKTGWKVEDFDLIEANEAASYVQELAGDDANIIFGAMYDENAQDEATITVIATGLDAHANTPVNKAMAEFGNFKPKMPSSLNLNTQSRTAAAEASATAPKAAPQLHAQAPAVKTLQTLLLRRPQHRARVPIVR